MNDRFATCVAFVLAREGGYVRDPADPGGCTNRGITVKTLSAWRGKLCTADDVLTLGEVEARAIYRARYWRDIQGDKLVPPLDLAMLDAAVNSGPRRAVMWLQEALDVPVDGVLGPRTLRELDGLDARAVAREVCRLRLAAMRRMSGWPRFGHGWAARILAVQGEIGATDS